MLSLRTNLFWLEIASKPGMNGDIPNLTNGSLSSGKTSLVGIFRVRVFDFFVEMLGFPIISMDRDCSTVLCEFVDLVDSVGSGDDVML